MKNVVQKPKYYLSRNQQVKQHCPNCGTVYAGNFCNRCGQSANEVNKPFKEFVSDFLGSLYAFDWRFWNSVKVLFTRPEKLSSEYLKGKRASFTPPFKLYFFVSFIFFFVVNWKAESGMDGNNTLFSLGESEFIIEGERDSLRQEQLVQNKPENIVFNIDSLKVDKEHQQDSVHEAESIFSVNDQKLKEVFKDQSSRKLFVEKALKYSSWMLFLLMPLYALLLMLFHFRRQKYFVGHLVFAINTHTLFFLIFTIMLLIDFRFEWILMLLLAYYMVRSMKKFYKQPWGKAILKFFILTTLYNFVLLAAFVLVFVISVGTS